MATVVLDAYTKPYPTIANRIRGAVFKQTDPITPIASIIDVTAGHPARIYHFPGLPRDNYNFSLDEIDGGGTPINNLAYFSVVPGGIPGMLSRDDEQIKEGVTTGFDAGISSIFFDGGGGRPDYIGWEIVPSELTGRGILVEGLDYSWNPLTGEFVWLQPGDILQPAQWYNIHFNPLNTSAPASPPAIVDFTVRRITADDDIVLADFGNTILAEPAAPYIELQLPDIATIPVGRPLHVEIGKQKGVIGVSSVNFLPQGGQVINFLRGKLIAMNNESFQIYRYQRVDLSNEWRVRYPDGNFKRVGESVGDDAIQTEVFCKHLLDGSSRSKWQFNRVYEEVVLLLPAGQVVDYDDWNTGNNKYFYSRANSANPANVDKFHFPDRRNKFERNNSDTGKAGDYQANQNKRHGHTIKSGNSLASSGDNADVVRCTGFGSVNTRGQADDAGLNNKTLGSNGGDEARPETVLINKYVFI